MRNRPWRRLMVGFLVALLAVAPAAVQADGGQPEVIGGRLAAPGEFPYMVALLHRGVTNRFDAQFCGGSLISPDTVLTAGHCVQGESASTIDVLVGTERLAGTEGQRVPVRKVRRHAAYDDTTLENDLAILQLGVSLPEAPTGVIGPGQGSLWSTGVLSTVTGWGDSTGFGDYAYRLRTAVVPVGSDLACGLAYGQEFISSAMMCAGPLVGGIDACNGDSGGPLVVDDGNGDPFQIGIVSWGAACAAPGFPGVYTRVASYSSLIGPYLDPDAAPDAPASVTAGAASGSVRVTWAPPVFDGGTAVTGSRVSLSPGGRVIAVGPTRRSLDVSGLARGQTYMVSVRARNALGLGPARTATVHLS